MENKIEQLNFLKDKQFLKITNKARLDKLNENLLKEDNRVGVIYKVINKINGKIYIGQTLNFKRRQKAHNIAAFYSKGKDYNYIFHKAIRKYGKDSLNWVIIWEGKSNVILLNELEVFLNHILN